MQVSKIAIKFSIVLLVIVFFSYYNGNMSPLGLMYGPLFYATNFKISLKKFYFHSVLPILFLTVFFLKYCSFFSWNYDFTFSYHSFYYLLSLISMMSYFIVIIIKKKNYSTAYSDVKKQLMYVIQPIYYLLFFFIFLLYLENVGFIIKLGFSIGFILNTFVGIIFLMALYYISENKKLSINIESVDENTKYNSADMLRYENELNLYFIESEFYLNNNISLVLLSENTGIPKHHLSRLFNSHMGKNFYQVISEHRIKYAEKRLREDSNLTIESLAYECGFNSRSSFNKYFKEYTSYSPSIYRLSFSY